MPPSSAPETDNLPPLVQAETANESDAAERQDTAPDVAGPDASPLARTAPARINPILRGGIRPLITIATSQYMLVAVLAILAAIVVSRQAAHSIGEKFLAVTQALKRF